MYSTINATGYIPWHCRSRSLQSSASFRLNTKIINTLLYDRVIGLAKVSGVLLMSTLSRHVFGVTRCTHHFRTNLAFLVCGQNIPFLYTKGAM